MNTARGDGLKARVRLGRTTFWVSLVVVYWVVAAAAFNGYYQKWRFFDGNPEQSVVAMLDGTASRPYVYRQLLPQAANLVQSALPSGARGAIEQRLQDARGALAAPAGADATKPGYALRYRIVYYLTFLSAFLSLFVLRDLAMKTGLGAVSATIAPAIFMLLMPLIQTRGGYFYDYTELLAFSAAAWLAYEGRAIPLILLAAPMTLNKESFLFFAVSLFPLLMRRKGLVGAAVACALTGLVSGVTYLLVRDAFAGNAGSTAIFQLSRNLAFYTNPSNLFLLENTYGVPFLKASGALFVGWLLLVFSYGWREAPVEFRRHTLLALLVNAPLFLLLAAAGEMRNLSMVFVGAVLMTGGALQVLLRAALSAPARAPV